MTLDVWSEDGKTYINAVYDQRGRTVLLACLTLLLVTVATHLGAAWMPSLLHAGHTIAVSVLGGVLIFLSILILWFPAGVFAIRRQRRMLRSLVEGGLAESGYPVHLLEEGNAPYGIPCPFALSLPCLLGAAGVLAALNPAPTTPAQVVAAHVVICGPAIFAAVFLGAARQRTPPWASLLRAAQYASVVVLATNVLLTGALLYFGYKSLNGCFRLKVLFEAGEVTETNIQTALWKLSAGHACTLFVCIPVFVVLSIWTLKRFAETWHHSVKPLQEQGQLFEHDSIGKDLFMALIVAVGWWTSLVFFTIAGYHLIDALISQPHPTALLQELARIARQIPEQLADKGWSENLALFTSILLCLAGVAFAFPVFGFRAAVVVKQLRQRRRELQTIRQIPILTSSHLQDHPSIANLLRKTSRKLSARVVLRVRKCSTTEPACSVQTGSREYSIVVSRFFFDLTDPTDQLVIITHEAGHCVLHHRKLRRLRLLSLLTSWDFSAYATYYLNLPDIEFEADQYAYAQLRHNEAARDQISACLARMDGAGTGRHTTKHLLLTGMAASGAQTTRLPEGALRRAIRGAEMLLGAEHVVYQHPALKTRIRRIQQYHKEHQDTGHPAPSRRRAKTLKLVGAALLFVVVYRGTYTILADLDAKEILDAFDYVPAHTGLQLSPIYNVLTINLATQKTTPNLDPLLAHLIVPGLEDLLNRNAHDRLDFYASLFPYTVTLSAPPHNLSQVPGNDSTRPLQAHGSLATLFIIDRSEAMAQPATNSSLTKMRHAQTALLAAATSLGEHDLFGLVTLSQTASVRLPLTSAAEQGRILRAIAGLSPMAVSITNEDPTHPQNAALDTARELLLSCNAATRHVVLIGDGLLDSDPVINAANRSSVEDNITWTAVLFMQSGVIRLIGPNLYEGSDDANHILHVIHRDLESVIQAAVPDKATNK